MKKLILAALFYCSPALLAQPKTLLSPKNQNASFRSNTPEELTNITKEIELIQQERKNHQDNATCATAALVMLSVGLAASIAYLSNHQQIQH